MLYHFKVTISTFLCKTQLCRTLRIQNLTDKPSLPPDSEWQLLKSPSWQTSKYRQQSVPNHAQVLHNSALSSFSFTVVADCRVSLPPLPLPHGKHWGLNHLWSWEGERPSQGIHLREGNSLLVCNGLIIFSKQLEMSECIWALCLAFDSDSEESYVC